MSSTVKVNAHPRILHLIRTSFSSYRKHDVILCAQSKVTCHGGAWSGGSRSHYVHVSREGGQTSSVANVPSAPQHFGGGEDPTVELEPGRLVVQGGTFRGKTAVLFIYGLKTDINWLLDRCQHCGQDRQAVPEGFYHESYGVPGGDINCRTAPTAPSDR